MKKEEKNILVLYKNEGKFYNAIGIDAYLLNYLFGYKVLNNKKAGFPENAFEKVIQRLDDEKISYQIIYTDKNPHIKDYKKINRYPKLIAKVNEGIELNKRVDLIIEKIKSATSEEMLEIIEKIEKCIK